MDKRIPIAIAIIILIASMMGVYYYTQQNSKKSDKLLIVASFYPLAELAKQIGGEMVEVKILIQPGVEVHSWQPSAGDLVACSEADVIIYNGAGLDNWLQEDILPSIDTTRKIIVDTTQNVTLFKNMEEEEIEEHGIYDPHTWISPYEAMQQAEAIYNALIDKDPSNVDYYTARWTDLSNKLKTLDTSYRIQLQNKTKSIIFVTHDAFGYLARRYDFEQEGIVGISADEQPSTQTLANIINLMQETNTYVFYIEPGYSDVYVQTVKTELQAKTGMTIRILTLYHMNGPQDGLDYFSQMEKNLESLRVGLGS
jgi:zinc transport system substrate-binding protein